MKLTLKKGYCFFQATSTFQKAIRRSDESLALYFAAEFFNSGYDEYLWKRIKVICSEDIGLAEPTLPANIAALYSSYTELKKEKKENKPERLFLVHAVLMLVRAKKSRLADWYMIKIWREHDNLHLDIPDYAIDMHNAQGKRMGRGIEQFYEEGTLLTNYHPQPGEEEIKAAAFELHKLSPGKLKFTQEQRGSSTLFAD